MFAEDKTLFCNFHIGDIILFIFLEYGDASLFIVAKLVFNSLFPRKARIFILEMRCSRIELSSFNRPIEALIIFTND